ncbi:SDR family NAD(P)-dependent oxidoreductase [Myxococcota bacterium]|nr:SDR family NAD(P)-dependent oxidoreductase [Myxococcota bacterium]
MEARWDAAKIPDQRGRTALVTGANSGIGFHTALELARKGARVILACRDPARGTEAVEAIRGEVPGAFVEFRPLDLARLESVREAAEGLAVEIDRLDLLVLNAGVMVPPHGKTADGFELQVGVNHLGHFALAARLWPLVRRTPGSRVVTVSSMAHRAGRIDLEDLHWERRRYVAFRAYGQSKLANLVFMKELDRRIREADLPVQSVAAHPGWTRTNLARHSGFMDFFSRWWAMDAAQGALPTLRAATDPEVHGGDYLGPDGWFEIRGWPRVVGCSARARDPGTGRALWEASERATGVRFPVGE